jgi:hypothetical protein
VCHVLCQVTLANPPTHLQTGETEPRPDDSRDYDQHCMLPLDDATREKLDAFSSHFSKPIADVIRQLVAETQVEDFPKSWHMAVEGHREMHAQQEVSRRRDEMPSLSQAERRGRGTSG